MRKRNKLTKRQIDVLQTLIFLLPFVLLWAALVLLHYTELFDNDNVFITIMLGVYGFGLGAASGKLDTWVRDYNDRHE